MQHASDHGVQSNSFYSGAAGRGTLTQRFRHIQGAGLKTEDLVVKSELKQTQDRDR